jgi:hypothetical protein
MIDKNKIGRYTHTCANRNQTSPNELHGCIKKRKTQSQTNVSSWEYAYTPQKQPKTCENKTSKGNEAKEKKKKDHKTKAESASLNNHSSPKELLHQNQNKLIIIIIKTLKDQN